MCKHILNNLNKNFDLIPIDKAANNIAIKCKKYYVEVILEELGILDGQGKHMSIQTEMLLKLLMKTVNMLRDSSSL